MFGKREVGKNASKLWSVRAGVTREMSYSYFSEERAAGEATGSAAADAAAALFGGKKKCFCRYVDITTAQ